MPNHVIFNSQPQLARFVSGSGPRCGMRTPGQPPAFEVEVALYDPCARYSRLGVTLEGLRAASPLRLDGLHFHTLCEKDSDALERTLAVVEERFGDLIQRVRWVNSAGTTSHEPATISSAVRLLGDCRRRHR